MINEVSDKNLPSAPVRLMRYSIRQGMYRRYCDEVIKSSVSFDSMYVEIVDHLTIICMSIV